MKPEHFKKWFEKILEKTSIEEIKERIASIRKAQTGDSDFDEIGFELSEKLVISGNLEEFFKSLGCVHIGEQSEVLDSPEFAVADSNGLALAA